MCSDMDEKKRELIPYRLRYFCKQLHDRIHWLCRVPVTLGKGQFALGKLFAECNTRQTPLGKASHGTVVFAECRISGTRHRSHVARPWAASLPSAERQALGKTAAQGPATWSFCRVLGLALGKLSNLRRVPSSRHSAKRTPRVPPCGRFAECWVLALGKLSNLCRVPGL